MKWREIGFALILFALTVGASMLLTPMAFR